MIYLILAKPFYEPLLNHLEVFNEVCILITEYHLIVFSDFLSGSASNSQAQDTAGNTMIAFTVINMVVNMGIMLWKTYHRARLSLGRLKLKYQAWKLRRAAKYALDSKTAVTAEDLVDVKVPSRPPHKFLSKFPTHLHLAVSSSNTTTTNIETF